MASKEETPNVSKQTPILYDSISVHLSLSVVVQQLLLHITFPLSVLFFIHKYGWLFLYTQSLIPTPKYGLFTMWMFWAILMIMLVAYALAPEELGYDVAFNVCLYMMHRCVVSLKYGSLSSTEYKRIIRGSGQSVKPKVSGYLEEQPTQEEIDRVVFFQNQLQLISGWVELGPKVVEFEVISASARLGINLRDYFIHVPSETKGLNERIQVERWRKLLASVNPVIGGKVKGMIEQPDGSYKIPADHLCVAIARRGTSKLLTNVLRISIFVISLLNAVMPISTESRELSTYAKLYYAMSFLNTFLFSVFILSFIHAAYNDFFRRLQYADVLTAMMRYTEFDQRVKLRKRAKEFEMTSHQLESRALNNILERSSIFSDDVVTGDMMDARNLAQRSRSLDTGAFGVALRDLQVEVDSDEEENDVDVEKGNEGTGGDGANTNAQKADLSKQLSSHFSQFDFSSDYDGDDLVPRIDMSNAHNMMTWFVTRSILRDFGARYHFRLNIYNGVVLFLAFGLALGCVATAFRSGDPTKLAHDPAFIHVITWIIFFGLSEASIVMVGFLVNIKMRNHKAAIALHVAGLKHTQEKLVDKISAYKSGAKDARGKPIDIDSLKEHLLRTDQALTTGVVLMDILERREPVEQLQVLGIPCEVSVSIGILSSLGVMFTALSQVVFVGYSSS